MSLSPFFVQKLSKFLRDSAKLIRDARQEARRNYPELFTNMPQIYIQKRDLPWSKAGTRWKMLDGYPNNRGLIEMETGYSILENQLTFYQDGFDEWFSEEGVDITLTKAQAGAVRSLVNQVYGMGKHETILWHKTFCDWLDKHTEG